MQANVKLSSSFCVCKVFCKVCVRFQVFSGPNHRPSQVCETCHVILVKDSSSSVLECSSSVGSHGQRLGSAAGS
ncbi:hypothetical protein WDU94_005987 [Cyamophila willieti]